MSLEITSKVEGDIAGLATLPRQIQFAAAQTATAVVREAQKEVIETIQETFVTRNPWFAPTNHYGIHYEPATVQNPTAAIKTRAWWLVPHETAAIKRPADGEFLAIPTEAIRPDVRQTIPTSSLPRNLAGAFILQTRSGPKLFQRLNRRLRMVYNLVRQVQIPKRSTVIQPTIATVEKRYPPLFRDKLAHALKTARINPSARS